MKSHFPIAIVMALTMPVAKPASSR